MTHRFTDCLPLVQIFRMASLTTKMPVTWISNGRNTLQDVPVFYSPGTSSSVSPCLPVSPCVRPIQGVSGCSNLSNCDKVSLGKDPYHWSGDVTPLSAGVRGDHCGHNTSHRPEWSAETEADRRMVWKFRTVVSCEGSWVDIGQRNRDTLSILSKYSIIEEVPHIWNQL